MTSIVTIGSMAFDSIETPFGRAEKILGGSVNYFSLSACFFSPVNCVSVVGMDFPREHLSLLKQKGIDTDGIQIKEGTTFFWAGRYTDNPNDRLTLDTKLNVFESFNPELPDKYRKSGFVFLGNISPVLQLKVLNQIINPRFIAIDTMNFWISGQISTLKEVISRSHCLIINETEIRQLTEKYNIVQAAELIQSWGPQVIAIKRGEYGAILFHGQEVFGIPALPLSIVKDPTGAGDSFAGGFMGYLASLNTTELSPIDFRRAMVYGSVMASFTVEDFGFLNLLRTNSADVSKRYQMFTKLTQFDVPHKKS